MIENSQGHEAADDASISPKNALGIGKKKQDTGKEELEATG